MSAIEEARSRIELAKMYNDTYLQLLDCNLSSDNLATLIPDIAQIPKLREINLSGNDLTTLPESIGQLTNLQRLDLNYNSLSTLPNSIGKLSKLRVLNLKRNKLTALPDSVANLVSLQVLAVRSNKLANLPETLKQLTELQELDLSYNAFTTFPEIASNFSAMQILNLNNNQITSLPEDISRLKRLKEFYFGNNQLSKLPSSMGRLAKLQTLDLSNNPIESLPDTMGKLSKLQFCSLKNNNLQLPKRLEINQLPAAVNYLKYRKTDSDWIPQSGMENLFLKKKSVTAMLETILMILVACIIILWSRWFEAFIIWGCMGVLLLLKTENSKKRSLTWFGPVIQKLKLKGEQNTFLRQWSFPFRLLVAGIASIIIDFAVTFWKCVRHPGQAIMAIPENYRFRTLQVDWSTPPEIISGSEETYMEDPDNRFTVTELKNMESFGFVIMGFCYVFSCSYRLLFKSTAVIYWPLFLINKRKTSEQLKNLSKNYIADPIQYIVFACCLMLVILLASNINLSDGFQQFADHHPISQFLNVDSQPLNSNFSTLAANHSSILGVMILKLTFVGLIIFQTLNWFLAKSINMRNENEAEFTMEILKKSLMAQYAICILVVWYAMEFVSKFSYQFLFE